MSFLKTEEPSTSSAPDVKMNVCNTINCLVNNRIPPDNTYNHARNQGVFHKPLDQAVCLGRHRVFANEKEYKACNILKHLIQLYGPALRNCITMKQSQARN